MKRTGFVYDERYLLHLTGNYHPECPERLLAIHKWLETSGMLGKLVPIKVTRANQRWIEAVHNIHYIMRFDEACIAGMGEFEHPDNAICRDTFETAFLAVGGVLNAIDAVITGEVDNAFCAVRPPGHHATRDAPMGFCFFNNAAVDRKSVV